MTYGTSHLLIGGWGGGGRGGGYFQGEGQEKYCCVRGGHYMKSKNIGGCVLSTQPDQQKRPRCKNTQKMQKNYKTLKNFSSLVSLTRHFTKLIFLEQLTAMPQFNMQNMFFFFFFFFLFFSKQSS